MEDPDVLDLVHRWAAAEQATRTIRPLRSVPTDPSDL